MSNYWNTLSPIHSLLTKRESHAKGGRVGLKNGGSSMQEHYLEHGYGPHKKHKKSQGSITRDDFYKIIKFVGRRNIIDSSEFLYKFNKKKLADKDICLTFDDSLKCQFDFPVLIINSTRVDFLKDIDAYKEFRSIIKMIHIKGCHDINLKSNDGAADFDR